MQHKYDFLEKKKDKHAWAKSKQLYQLQYKNIWHGSHTHIGVLTGGLRYFGQN